MINRKIIIIPVSYCYPFFQNSASERFRCDWLLTGLPADKYDGTQDLDSYDIIIYQKAHCDEMIEISKSFSGKIQIFDTVDPEWITHEKQLSGLIPQVDFITTSTKELTDGLGRFDKPVFVVPDRHNLSYYTTRKQHTNCKPILVWFGYTDNFMFVEPLLPIIEAYELELITICERPAPFGRFVEWNLKTANEEIVKGDIVLNLPDYYGYKSNNKTVTGWLLGMPVVEKVSDLFRFLDYTTRVREGNDKQDFAMKNYDVEASCEQLNLLIDNHIKT